MNTLLISLCLALAIPKPRDPHTIRMITVEPGVKIEVIDFGGKGPALLFLPGLGNTAHVYDEFAPRFANKYHVFGITRRGFGASSMPQRGYDRARLAKDVIAVMDSLKIKKAVVAGHSISGQELTELGHSYTNRIAGLIYLDAAYDHATLIPLLSKYPGPSNYLTRERTANVSLVKLRDAVSYARGVELPLNEFYQTTFVTDDGIVRGDRPAAFGQVIAALQPLSYRGITVPALSFFAIIEDPKDQLPRRYPDLDAKDKVLADSMTAAFARATHQNIDKFRTEYPTAHMIKLFGSRHYIFTTDARRVESDMRDFLKILSWK